MTNNEDGIFSGLENIANRYLLDPTWERKNGKKTNFGHKKNCLLLSLKSVPKFFNAENMIHEMYGKIESNISNRDKDSKFSPSRANFDFSFRCNSEPSAGKKTISTKPEVTLERAIIKARRKPSLAEDEWTYQMPVASGLFGKNTDKSSNIDLVRKQPEGVFDLIELKIGSNNPLYAAVEILRYGLAYAASRKLAEKIGYDKTTLEILSAKIIRLLVLAPPPFYDPRYKLAWLEDELNNALKKFSQAHDYSMLFEFQLLNYDWKATDSPTEEQLVDINIALDGISRFNWDKAIEKHTKC